jgi:hypothetical protein
MTSKNDNISTPTEIRDHVLSIFAYHVGSIMKDRHLNGFGLHVPGGPEVFVTMKIVAYSDDENSDWDQVEVNGVRVGNRCAARDEYTKLCTPVIAAACALVK